MKYTARFVFGFLLVVAGLVLTSQNANAQEAFSATTGNNPGEVVLTWKKSVPDASNYNIVFGPENNKTQFSAVNIDGNVQVGKQISYTVRFLNANSKYFFGLSIVKGKVALPAPYYLEAQSKGGVVKLPENVTQGTAVSNPGTLTSIVANDKITNQSASNIKSSGVGLHQLSVKKAAPGEVILSWKKVYKDVNNYDIVYGTEPGKLQYGAQNLGNITSFAVKSLDPKKQYYFALVPKKDKEAKYITQQASTVGATSAPHEEIKQAAGAPSIPTATNSSTGTTTTGTTNTINTTNTTTGTTTTTNSTNTTTTTSGGTTGTNTNTGSTTTTTTTTTTTKTDTKDTKEKKVKGAETEFNFWHFVRSLFSF